MYDKQVRRRRAVLALLVSCSLILLTAYFGASPASPLHAIQQGIAEVFTPIQAGASKVLSPVRNVFGWVSDTVHAQSENAQLKRDNQLLRTRYDAAKAAQLENRELLALIHLDNASNLNQYGLLAANVISANPQVWYETITVDKGTADGVHLYDPVIGQRGLVGDVTAVGSNFALVSEVTANKFAVGARVLGGSSQSDGVLQPSVGNPTSLQLEFLPNGAQVSPGDPVVTSGFKDPRIPQIRSRYPPGIPIGTVASAGYDAQTNSQQVQVSPAVDLRNLSVVQILTNPPGGGG